MTTKRCVLTLLISFLILTAGTIQAVDYKEYKATRLETEYFEISFDKEEVRITTFEDGDAITTSFPKSSLSAKNGRVSAEGTLLFDDLGLLMDGQHYYYDSVYSTHISEDDKIVTITFYTRKPSATRTSRFKRGNIIGVGKPIIIEEDDFIRGTVIAVGTDVEIYGEVNRDIIAIEGDIYVGPDAVARGDIAVINGSAELADNASIYGEVYDVERHRVRFRHRFARDMHDWDFLDKLTYDRVDGLGLYLGVEYRDPDSLLPVFSVSAGYAFNSERWRFNLGLEQTVLRQPAIAVGANYYRRLANEDGWLLGDDENTVFALLATEDFRDYYEAEGGSIYAKARPWTDITVEAGYRHEETGWLDGRRHLWSMFGGNKLFPENFNTVNDDFRAIGIAEVDTTNNGVLYAHAAWDTRDKIDPFDESAWYVTADLEWAGDGLSSDFDYRRYMLGVRRYQKINRRATLVARGIYAGSDGYLPMYKRFFLGGLGTLQGYDHKEYMGTRFWMLNTEYRFRFPRLETAVAVFWDMGQIANDRKLDSSVDVKNDVGLAVYFEDDFRISLAKRLDRSFDDNPVFYVRLDHVF